MANVVHKHDLMAKSLFLDLDTAQDFLAIHLPAEILQICDLPSLNIESSSFIDGSLRPHYSDILYGLNLYPNKECSVPEKAYIYVLIEHQRDPEKAMPLTMFRHHLNALEQHLDKFPDNQLKLPLIIPIVFYNGKRSPYPYPSDMADMFANKDLYHKFGRIGTFKLIDLTVIDDDEIKQHKKIAAVEFAMKHISDRDFLLKLDEIVDIITTSAKYGLSAKVVGNTIIYLAADHEQQESAVFMRDITSKLHHYKDEIMTYAEALEQKGLQKGLQEGRQEGRQEGERRAQHEIAIEFLRSGDSAEKVAKCTHLPLEEVQTLQEKLAQ